MPFKRYAYVLNRSSGLVTVIIQKMSNFDTFKTATTEYVVSIKQKVPSY